MATGAEILNYTGNAGLGLGSNPGISALQKENTDLSDIHQAFRDVMLLNHENQMHIFDQQVKDRDTMRQMLENGQIPSGEIDPEYRPLYDAQEKKVEDAWHNVNGVNDTKNLEVFNREKRNLQDLVTQAQERTLMTKKLEVDKSQATLPEEQKSIGDFISKEKSKPFWERINPYVKPFSGTTEELDKAAKYLVDKKPATVENPVDTETTTFDWDGTKKTIDALYMSNTTGKEAENMRFLLNSFQGLPYEKRVKALTAMNNQLSKAETETGTTIPKIDFDPETGLINDFPTDFAAKYVAAKQEQFKSQSAVPNKDFIKLGTEKGTLAETIRNDREKNAIEWAKLAIDKKKADAQIKLWDTKTTGSTQAKSAALDYATNLYGQLKQLTDNAGVIDVNKIRQLTAEQLKYLGFYQEATDKNGNAIKGLNPLTIADGDIIQLKDGKIQVMKDAKFDDKTGRWYGKWDNTKTTTINNIATNRLNEENQLSAGKEINGYANIDSGGENDGAETPGTTETQSLSTNVSDWKQEGNNWRYKDGTLYDAKGNVVKEKK